MFANFLCEKVLKTSTAKWADLKDENEFLNRKKTTFSILDACHNFCNFTPEESTNEKNQL